jgi:ferredoxin
MLRIPVVDKEICISCEVCTHICPEVFEMQKDGKSGVHNPTGAPEEKIEEAMNNCPVACITWEE